MDLSVLGISAIVGNPPGVIGTVRGVQHFAAGAPLIPSAEEVITREKLVDGEVKAVDADVQANVVPASASSPGAAAFLKNWTDYKTKWDAFFAAHQTTGSIVAFGPFGGPGTGTVNREVTGFENQLAGFRAALAQQFPNAKLTSQPIQSTDNANLQPLPSTVPAKAGLPTWAVVSLTLAGVGVAGYLGWRAYSALSPTAKLARAIGGATHHHVAPNDLYMHRLRVAARDCHACGAPQKYAGDYGPNYEGVPVE